MREIWLFCDFSFFDYMLLLLPMYESYILDNHKIIFTVFSDGSLWSSGMKPHLKRTFILVVYLLNLYIEKVLKFTE